LRVAFLSLALRIECSILAQVPSALDQVSDFAARHLNGTGASRSTRLEIGNVSAARRDVPTYLAMRLIGSYNFSVTVLIRVSHHARLALCLFASPK
jgi:hypothetical protein